jgi:hypothetical protein
LDLTNLGETTPEEVNANLIRVWGWRGPLYELYANSLMLDYAPDFAKPAEPLGTSPARWA